MFHPRASVRFILVVSALVVCNSFGDAKPLDLFNGERNVFPGFETNLNRKKVEDVLEGKRDVRISAGTDGIRLESGYSQLEITLMAVGGIALAILVICSCCCACLRCCGRSRT